MAQELEINEEQRSYLLVNAENLVFVDEKETVDKYKCLSCGSIAIKHHVTNCKHLFCSNCIKELYYKPCPSCNVEIAEVMKDAQIEKRLLELNVECLYKKHGCQEIVPLRKYQEHNETCQMLTKELLLKFDGGQSQKEKLKEYGDDIRQIKSAIKEIREELKKEASQNETVEALASISENIHIIKNDVSQLKTMHHDSEKRFQQLQSELEARKEREKKTNENINATQKKVYDLIARIGKTNKLPNEDKLNDDERVMQQQGNPSVDPDDFASQGIVISWKIEGFTKKWQDMNSPIPNQSTVDQSEQRHLSQHYQNLEFGFRFSVNAIFGNPNIAIYLSKFECISIFSHARKFTLVDQSGGADTTSVTYIDTPLFSRNSNMMKRPYFRSNILAPISLLEKHFDVFVKDDSLLIELCLIPLTIMYKSVASRNGIFMWRIDNYSKKKQEETEGTRRCLTSDTFYTDNQGYRVQAYLYLNGDGRIKGESISLYIDFIKGKFDNSLPTPFNAMAKFILRDQSDSSSKQHVFHEIMFPHREHGPCHGKTDFVKQSQAEEARYLKEDALLFKIMVEIM